MSPVVSVRQPGRPDRGELERRDPERAADPDGLAELRAYLEQFWATALQSFKAIVEQPAQEDP